MKRPPQGPWQSRHLSSISLRCRERKRNGHPQESPILQLCPFSRTSSSFCTPELSLSMDLSLPFCTPSSGKVQQLRDRILPPPTGWLCELSKGPEGALPQWYSTLSPLFSLSPHPDCSMPADACPSQDTHILGFSFTVTSASAGSHFLGAQCSGTQASHSLQAITHLPGHPRNLLGLGPGPGSELEPGASAPEVSQLLLRVKEMVLPQKQDQRRGV